MLIFFRHGWIIKILEMTAVTYKDQSKRFEYGNIILFYYLFQHWGSQNERLLERLLILGGPGMRLNCWMWAFKIWGHSQNFELAIQYRIWATKLKQNILGGCFVLFETHTHTHKAFELLNIFSALEMSWHRPYFMALETEAYWDDITRLKSHSS